MERKDSQSNIRLYVLGSLLALALVVYIGVLYDIQINQHDYYLAKSIRTITQEETVEASRGVITDRSGREMVSSRSSYNLTFDSSALDEGEDENQAILRLVELCQSQGVTWVDNLPITKTAPFSYTFTGTGTTFFARTTNNTAYMKVVVTDGEGNIVYQLMRDTSYKTENDGTTLYNIPVFTYMADEYGTYTVTVTLARNVVSTMHYGTDFWLDGIRVYNPMNPNLGNYATATAAYARDGEANMTSATLREKLLVDYTKDSEDGSIEWIGDGFVIFTDSDGAIVKAADYQSKGPKEEVYLNDGQSVTFSLANWNPNQHKIYLGIKAPMAGGTVTIGNKTIEIHNTCDCYYDISDPEYASIKDGVATFKITAGEDSLISVTNIKVTGDAEFTIVDNTDIDVDA